MKVIPVFVGRLGGGINQLNEDTCISELFEKEERMIVCKEMQKFVLWESESIVRKVCQDYIKNE